jgi:chemotaxis protein MotB
MAEENKDQPIIIVKKGGKHGGHHGGAWKVAYADFVTAMMAFFLVMWLVSQSDNVKKAVQGYFQDPTNYGKSIKVNIVDRGAGILKGASTGEGRSKEVDLEEQLRKEMEELAAKLKKAIEEMPGLNVLSKHVELEITREGLRIQLIEGSEDVSFFRPGSANLSIKGELILKTIAMELSKLENQLVIEGHTDAADYGGRDEYSNWELSADRANAARRAMMENELKSGQVFHVRGYAANRLRVREDPYDHRNRRITILVLNRITGKLYPEDQYQSSIIMSDDN